VHFFVVTARVVDLPVFKALQILRVHPAAKENTKTKRAAQSLAICAHEVNTRTKRDRDCVCPVCRVNLAKPLATIFVKNARKTITPTNPNKPHAKRVLVRKKHRIQVLPFVSNVMRGNSCPPRKYAHVANQER